MLSLVLPGTWRWVLLVPGGEVQVGTVLERRLEENMTANVLTPLVQCGPGWPHWRVGQCLPVKAGCLGVLVVGRCFSAGSNQAAWGRCSHRTGCCWLFCICKVILRGGLCGQVGSPLQGERPGTTPGLGKGGRIADHISGDRVGHVSPLVATRGDVSASLCSCGTGLSVQKAAGWLGNAHRPSPGPGILWGLGQGEALGWGRGGVRHGPLPALPAAPGKLTVIEPVLSQRSAITHSRKPRQLLSVPRRAGPHARESIVHEGLLAPRWPPCREVPGSP